MVSVCQARSAYLGARIYTPQHMQWLIVVLLPKGGGNYRGISLLAPFWKVVKLIMDERLQVIDFHEPLRGFLIKQGNGIATTEAKLVQ